MIEFWKDGFRALVKTLAEHSLAERIGRAIDKLNRPGDAL